MHWFTQFTAKDDPSVCGGLAALDLDALLSKTSMNQQLRLGEQPGITITVGSICIYMCTWTSRRCIFWSEPKSSERPKIEQLLILHFADHIWRDQKNDAKGRRKEAKDQLFDTKSVS